MIYGRPVRVPSAKMRDAAVAHEEEQRPRSDTSDCETARTCTVAQPQNAQTGKWLRSRRDRLQASTPPTLK